MNLRLSDTRARRTMSLTPMIDVVFLLLVFFMLAARFDVTASVPVGVFSEGVQFDGPPRLIDVLPDGLALNGVATDLDGLGAGLAPLMDDFDDLVVLRPKDGASVQRIVDVMSNLRGQGFLSLTLVE